MKNIVFITLICIVVGCTNKKQYDTLSSSRSNVQSIDLNKALEQTVYNQSDIIDSIKKIVFLETNDSSLIHPPILKMEITDERIYISDIYQSMGLIIFDQNGKFIKRLPQGNGPGEIVRMIDFTFDKFANQLIVYGSPFVYLFDEDGNYIDVKITSFSADVISATSDEYLFGKIPGYENSEIEDNDDYSVIVTDKNLKIKSLMCHYISNRPVGLTIDDINNKLYISVPDGDTIYYYDNHNLTSQYVLNYSEHKVIPTEPVDYSKPMDGFTYDGSYLETEHHQVIDFTKGRYGYVLFRNKENGHIIGGDVCRRITEEEISIQNPATTFHNQYVSSNSPYNYPKGSLKSDKYISEADRLKLEALEDDDNPFLVFYTLKDF